MREKSKKMKPKKAAKAPVLKIKGKWKAVKVEPDVFAAPEFDCFMGIEELTDYSFVKQGLKELEGKKKKAKKVKNKKSVGKKKKSLKEEENDSEKMDVEDIAEDDLVEDHPIATDTTDMPAWNDLFVPQCVLKAMSELNFTSPTSIQALTLPSAIRDRMDILGAAETGSGKTLAFGIPIIHHILEDKRQESMVSDDSDKPDEPPLRALILTPTRELAIQVKTHIQNIAKYTDIKIASIVGGISSEKQKRILKKCPDIVVATPGRLWELIEEGEPHLSKASQIKYVVVDEADRMAEKGHFEELTQLMQLLNSRGIQNKKRQTFIFSATLTFVHKTPRRVLMKRKKYRLTRQQKLDDLMKLVGINKKPKIIDLSPKLGTAESLSEAKINCSLSEKDFYLHYFLQMFPGRTLIFCNSIDCIRRLRSILLLLGYSPLPLHANMHQKQRLKNLESFTEKPNSLLLASDVAARGLDIQGIEHVVHYQVPRTAEVYIHRSGRTARLQREGFSLLLMEPKEIAHYQQICRSLNRNEDIPIFPIDHKMFKVIQTRVGLAQEIDKLEHRTEKLSAHNRWFFEKAKELEIDIDDDRLLHDLGPSEKQAQQSQKIKHMKKELASMLRQPIMPEGFSGRYLTKTGELSIPYAQKQSKASAVTKESKKATSKMMSDPNVIKAIKKWKQRKKKPKRKGGNKKKQNSKSDK